MSPSPAPGDAFGSEKKTAGGITLLSLRGTLTHAFEGRKVAGGVSTKKVIINMRGVKRFASWGMSEWMDFLRMNQARDLYIIEASTYATSQLNLVTGLLGHAKLVSFYASYRCRTCNNEVEARFLIPREREAIRYLPGSEQECPKCGAGARLEEYPASFFDTIAERPAFDIDDEVLDYLKSELAYDIQPDRTRFRAFRRMRDKYTYLRLSGSVTGMAPQQMVDACEGVTVVDLEQAAFDEFDPNAMEPWRTFVKSAMAKVPSLQLLHCPPGFLESGVVTSDLHDKLKVRTFACVYDCARCNTTSSRMVDVADNLEQLAQGIAPPSACPSCSSLLQPTIVPLLVPLMRALPARDRDPVLDKFLDKARTEPIEKLENVLLLEPKKAKSSSGPGRAMYVAIGLTMTVLLGLGGVAFMLWKDRGETTKIVETTAPIGPNVPPPKPSFERPDWVLSDLPSSAYCQDMINRLMCVGVSLYRPTRDEGVADANAAALDELVNAVGLKIASPFFREHVMGAFTDTRRKALSTLQQVDLDRESPTFVETDKVVLAARKRVVDVLQASGGAAVPAQRTDWYWEEYNAKGGGTEFLVFVRYDVPMDAVKVLVEKYGATTQVADSSVMTAFPALAWRADDFTGGAMVVKPSRALAEAGVAKLDVVMKVGDQAVGDAVAFGRNLDDWKPASGPLKLDVKSPDAAARTVELRRR